MMSKFQLSDKGNLYYALTHSPEPLSDDESFTLSWEAATKRLEAAGSIPVREAELMAEALRSNEAGIEVGAAPHKNLLTDELN